MDMGQSQTRSFGGRNKFPGMWVFLKLILLKQKKKMEVSKLPSIILMNDNFFP